MTEISALSGYKDDGHPGFEKPVLSINDLSRLNIGDIVVLDDSRLPYTGHLPDWEAWGITDKIPYTASFHIQKTDRPVSLRTLLGISEDTPMQNVPDEPLPSKEPEEEDALEKAVQRGMTIQSVMQKLDSDPEFTEQLQRLLEEKDTPVTKIDDDDDLPF